MDLRGLKTMTIILSERQKERIRALVKSAKAHGKEAEDLQKEIDEALKMVII